MQGNFGYTGGGAPLPGQETAARLSQFSLMNLLRNQAAAQAGPGAPAGPADPLAASREQALGMLDQWRNFYNGPQAQQLASQIMARASGADRPYDDQTVNRIAGRSADASARGLQQQEEMIRQHASARGMSGGGMGSILRARREHNKNVRGSRRDAEIEATRGNWSAKEGGQAAHQGFLAQAAANLGNATNRSVNFLEQDEVTSNAGPGGTFGALGGRGPGQRGIDFGFRQEGGQRNPLPTANSTGDWQGRAQARDQRGAINGLVDDFLRQQRAQGAAQSRQQAGSPLGGTAGMASAVLSQLGAGGLGGTIGSLGGTYAQQAQQGGYGMFGGMLSGAPQLGGVSGMGAPVNYSASQHTSSGAYQPQIGGSGFDRDPAVSSGSYLSPAGYSGVPAPQVNPYQPPQDNPSYYPPNVPIMGGFNPGAAAAAGMAQAATYNPQPPYFTGF